MKVAYFTAGNVGAGHLVRGLAIERGLRRAGFGGELLKIGPPLPFDLPEGGRHLALELRDDLLLRDPRRAASSGLARELVAFAPDLLLVDMFWAPLYHFLGDLPGEKWLLLRTCPRVWLEGPPKTPFDPSQYDRIVAIEPLDRPHVSDRLDPIVVANPDERRPPGALRERLGVAPGERLVVVAHAGLRGELAELAEQPREVEEGRVVCLDLFDRDPLFPAAEWLHDADAVVSGAGYNAYWEARWMGYAERTTFVPLDRRIDDQAHRLRSGAGHAMAANGADTLARWILAGG